MKLDIDKMLSEKGKTRYWLAKQTGIAPNNIAEICNGKTKSISFDILEKICLALDATPNDIFKIQKGTD